MKSVHLQPQGGDVQVFSQTPSLGSLYKVHVFIEAVSAAAAAKSLQSCRLCETPEMAAHQATPSLGFSRQEHWSGSPFPSPKAISRED